MRRSSRKREPRLGGAGKAAAIVGALAVVSAVAMAVVARRTAPGQTVAA